jgi:hypothetical protein
MRAVCAAVALSLVVPCAAAAHEIGTTTVRLTSNRAGYWTAAITTAPQALVNKLEAAHGEPRSPALDAVRLRQRLDELMPALLSHIDWRFDGVRCQPSPAIDALEVPPDLTRAAFVVIALGCGAPAGAAQVSWRDDLVYSTYALVVDRDGDTRTEWIEGDAGVSVSLKAATRRSVVAQYLTLGFEHILPKGLDHILFVLGMFLLTRASRPLFVQVTSFTLAHSITLGLTMYGVVSLPPTIVEPLISVSIAYVAIENLFLDRISPWRPAVVFGFGLLHGMGFAGVLRDLRLARADVLPALVSFNTGIELAQLTVIAVALACTARVSRHGPQFYRARIVIPISALIAVTALAWTVERVAGP